MELPYSDGVVSTRARLIRLLFLAAGAAVLSYLIAHTGPGVIAAELRHVGVAFIAVVALYLGHLTLRAAALWSSLPAGRIGFRGVLRIRFAGEAVEMLTFTGPFLAEPAKGWLLLQGGATGPEAFGAVAIEYLLYTVVAAGMTIGALSMLLARGALPEGLRNPARGLIAAMIAFTAGCLYASISGRGLIVPIVGRVMRIAGRRRAAAAVSAIDPVERVLVGFLHQQPKQLAAVLALEIGTHALLVAEIWVVFRALRIQFAPAVPFLIEGSIKFITVAFAFVPGQLGAAEATYTLLAVALGLPMAAGLTLGLVRRIRALLAAALGLPAATDLGQRRTRQG